MYFVHYKNNENKFGSHSESFLLSLFFVIFLWLIFLLIISFPDFFVRLGIQGRQIGGLKGIIFSPIIHDPKDIFHIINNTFPAFVLIYALLYFYRKIAFKVFIFSWIFSGIILWLIASNKLSYHIGFSSIIYSLFSFLFFTGVLSRFLPLQALSLFVVFIYGSMVWGVFPLEEKVSWEGHLSGFIVGIILSFIYFKQAPKPPKFQYEIEKELGIEPPDYEAEWNKINSEFESEENINRLT